MGLADNRFYIYKRASSCTRTNWKTMDDGQS